MTTTETMPTSAKTYPRYRRNARVPNSRELAVPLPPLLVEQLGDAREVVEHRRVAARLDELTLAVVTQEAALRRAQDELSHAERAALKAGRPVPAKAAAKVETEQERLDKLHRELATAEATLEETAQALLVASVEHVTAAFDEARERGEHLLDAAEERLRQALDLLDGSRDVAAQSMWLAGLREHGEAHPFGKGRAVQVRGRSDVAVALAAVVEGRARRGAAVADVEREEAALNSRTVAGTTTTLPDPPAVAGAWQLPDPAETT
jgi:hypothetical protein